MSAQVKKLDDSARTNVSATSENSASKPRTKRRWLRRLLVVGLLLALVLRIALPTIVESAARSWAEGQGLDLEFEELDLALTSGRVALWGVELSKDGDRALRVETVDLDLDMDALLSGDVVVRRAEIDGVDARLERAADGSLTLFSGATSEPEPESAEDETGGERRPLESLALPFAVHAARVQRVSLEWKDAAVDPVVDLTAELDLSISDLGTGPGPARARLRFAAPGAVEQIALDAQLTATDERLDGRLRLDLSGVHGGAAEAYLAGIGIEPPSRAQDLRIEATADLALRGPDALEGSIEITQSLGRTTGAPRRDAATAERAPETWLELASVRAAFEPDTHGTAIAIASEGLALEAERARDGRFVLAGFVLGGGSDDAAGGAADDAPTPTGKTVDADANDADADGGASPSAPDPLRLVRIDLRDAELALIDRAVAADGLRTALAIDALGLDLEAEDGIAATLDARAPGLFETARIEASFGAQRGEAHVSFGGLTLESARPYLVAAGLEPSGATCELSLVLEQSETDGRSLVHVTQLSLVEGPRTALEVASLRFEDANGVIDAALEGLVARPTSEAPGRTTFGPLRMGALSGEAAGSAANGSSANGSSANGSNSTGSESTGSNSNSDDLRVAELRLDARVTGLDTSGAGAPAEIVASLTAPGLVDAIELGGTLALPEQGVALEADLSVDGLREAALAAVRPDPSAPAHTARASLRYTSARGADGRDRIAAAIEDLVVDGVASARSISFDGSMSGGAGSAPQGTGSTGADLDGTGLSGTLRAEGLDVVAVELSNATLGVDVTFASDASSTRARLDELVLGDGDTSLRVGAVEFASTTEADGGTLIETLRANAIEIDALRTEDGALVVAGAVVVPAPDAAAADPRPAAGGGPVANDGSTGPALDDDAPAPRADAPTRLALGTLELEVARLEILDAATGTRTRARLRLANDAPAVLFDPIGSESPLTLRLDAALEPGVEQLSLALTTAPDDAGADVNLTLEVSGISDRGLLAAWPELGDALVEGGVEGGRLELALDARIDAPRTSAVDFDLRRLVDATLDVTRASFVPQPQAEPGFALGSARVQLRSLGGDGAPLRLGEVELADARVVVEQLEDATSIAGIKLRRSAEEEALEEELDAAESAAGDDAGDAAAEADARVAATESPAEREDASGGIAIDHLAWAGLDLVYTDRRHDPPTQLPIDTFDLDVRNLAIGGPMRRPLQLRLSLSGAQVDLPDQPEETDILSSLARELTGSGERTRSERPWLDELLVAGNLQPDASGGLTGWVRTELYGFELLALESLAGEGGVEIGGGIVDSNVRVDLRGEQGQRIKSRTTFTTLSVQEPPDGPISRFLRLPAPLDVVLWVLRNERGEQVVPLAFTIDDSGVSTTELVTQGTQALVLLITDALASSPLRLGGGLLDMVGFDPFGSDDEDAGAGEPITLDFAVGATRLDEASQAGVTEVLRVLAEDDTAVFRVGHRFSQADIDRARAFAVPDPEDSLQLATRLEVDRDESVARLVYGRERLARLVATGAEAEAEQLANELREDAARLDELERTLDTLWALSVPADERTREKRLRAAALRLAERRYESVVRELFARGAEDALERLQFVRPRTSDVDTSDTALGSLVFTPRGR